MAGGTVFTCTFPCEPAILSVACSESSVSIGGGLPGTPHGPPTAELRAVSLCGQYLAHGGRLSGSPYVSLSWAAYGFASESFRASPKGACVSALATASYRSGPYDSVIVAAGCAGGAIQLFRHAEGQLGAASAEMSRRCVCELEYGAGPGVTVTSIAFAGGPDAFFAAAQDGSVRLFLHKPDYEGFGSGSGSWQNPEELWSPWTQPVAPRQGPPPRDECHEGLPSGALKIALSY